MTRAITVRTHGRRAAALAVLALTTPMVLTACGEDEGHATPGPAKVAIEVTEQGQGKFALRAPTSVPAGLVEISLRVPAGAGTHDAQIVRVTGDRTAQEVVAAVSSQGEPLPEWLTPAGGVGQTDGSAVGKTVQRLQPGRYFILDTDEPEGDDVKSYAQTGATAALEVTGEQSTANLPRSDATVTARDYAFDVSELADGRVRIAFRNAGTEPHHVVAFPYREGATLDAVKTFFTEEGEPSGPPPVDFAGATRTTALAGGEEQIAELDLRRGRYALLCFLSDRAGGPPHAMMGMVAEAVVR
jgi:hypothetical protein